MAKPIQTLVPIPTEKPYLTTLLQILWLLGALFLIFMADRRTAKLEKEINSLSTIDKTIKTPLDENP